MQVITKAHMNRREIDHVLLHTWFSYTERKFVMAVFPETDADARHYIPQNAAAQRHYEALRDQRQTIRQALTATLDWVIKFAPQSVPT